MDDEDSKNQGTLTNYFQLFVSQFKNNFNKAKTDLKKKKNIKKGSETPKMCI